MEVENFFRRHAVLARHERRGSLELALGEEGGLFDSDRRPPLDSASAVSSFGCTVPPTPDTVRLDGAAGTLREGG